VAVTAEGARRRRIAVYGLSRDDAGRVLLVPSEGGGWALPGGTVGHGESPQAAVARLVSATTGLRVRVRGVRDARSDQVHRSDGVVVHHDRLVFELQTTGQPTGTARWVDTAVDGVPLLAYTADVLGLDGDPRALAGPHVDPDDGWPVDRGFATDRSGPRLRVQRFSTYALACDPDGRVLLARIAPEYPGSGRWHLPGGGTDFGEAPTAALLREVVEETGQHGRVVGLLSVSHRHNPSALGKEGFPIDWHTIRVVYRVAVDEPTEPRVTEAAGGSTVEAAWFRREQLRGVPLTELASTVLAATAPGIRHPG
jgi:8-oxo-dGTP diphosphatase